MRKSWVPSKRSTLTSALTYSLNVASVTVSCPDSNERITASGSPRRLRSLKYRACVYTYSSTELNTRSYPHIAQNTPAPEDQQVCHCQSHQKTLVVAVPHVLEPQNGVCAALMLSAMAVVARYVWHVQQRRSIINVLHKYLTRKRVPLPLTPAMDVVAVVAAAGWCCLKTTRAVVQAKLLDG